MQTLFDRVLSEQPPKVLKASDMEDGKLPRYPSENGVVQFTAYVTSATISSDDHDYRLVLKSPESESVMLGESPDPSCPTFNAFPQLRTTFIQAGKDISNIMELLKSNNKPVKVSVTGVPFWDAPDPQKGGNPGGLEIHPLLKVSVISD